MLTPIFALLLTFGSLTTHAQDACPNSNDELALWDKAESIAEALPKIFRYTVTIDDRRAAIIAEPRCVVSVREDHRSWEQYVVRGNLLYMIWTSNLDVTYPAWTNLTNGKVDQHRVTLQHQVSTMTWYGEIIRDEALKRPFSLAFSVPDCPYFSPSYSDVYRRLEDGRVISNFYRRQQIERAQKKCLKASGV